MRTLWITMHCFHTHYQDKKRLVLENLVKLTKAVFLQVYSCKAYLVQQFFLMSVLRIDCILQKKEIGCQRWKYPYHVYKFRKLTNWNYIRYCKYRICTHVSNYWSSRQNFQKMHDKYRYKNIDFYKWCIDDFYQNKTNILNITHMWRYDL